MATQLKMNRRKFCKICSAVTTTALFSTGAGLIPGCKYFAGNVLLTNGLVYVDGRYQQMDIAVKKGKVTAMHQALSPEENMDVIDCSGCYISPGWVDLHCHIGQIGVQVCRLGLKMGVTALADAGTYGPETFNVFLDKHYNNAQIPLYAFLNLRKGGLTYTNILSKNVPGVEDAEGAVGLIEKHPEIIKGLKVRTDSSNTSENNPTFLADVTAGLGVDLDMPVVYHLGNPQPSILDYLKTTKSGDIITHCLRKTNNSIVDQSGKIRPEVIDAASEGVLFDVGHGVASFSFQTAEAALNQGFNDFTISSDIWSIPSLSRAYTFANVASKFLALGLSIEDITKKISTRPREILGIQSTIDVGTEIDLTVFSIHEGDFKYTDSANESKIFGKRIIPEYTILKGYPKKAGCLDRTLFV